MRVRAARELLAPPEDVWTFLAEPHHFPDWWPGIAGVQPDRKGVSRGARWGVSAGNRPTLLKKPRATDVLVVTAADPMRRFAFQLTGERIDADLTLEPRGGRRTFVELTVSGPFLVGFRRVLPRQALSRLYALCQTAADS